MDGHREMESPLPLLQWARRLGCHHWNLRPLLAGSVRIGSGLARRILNRSPGYHKSFRQLCGSSV